MDNSAKIGNLNDLEVKMLHDFYVREEVEISRQIAELTDQLQEVRSRISVLFGRGEYNSHWTIIQKAEFVLQIAKKLLTTSEIAESIYKYEGARIEGLVSKLSATLKQKVDLGQVVGRYEDTGGFIRYGLIEWFDKNGPRQQYKNEAANDSPQE